MSYKLHEDADKYSDLKYCLDENPQNGFTYQDVAGLYAQVPGEADGPNWYWLCALKDGRTVLVVGGCDYTGWGCQDWGTSQVYPDPMTAAQSAEDKQFGTRKGVAAQLIAQLNDKQPYGTWIGEPNA